MMEKANLGPKLRIDEEFEGLIPEPSRAEMIALEGLLAAEGLRDPLVVWRPPGEKSEPPVILDGHQRYRICRERGIEYRVRELEFGSREEAATWVIVTHIGRNSLTDAGKCEVALNLEPRLKPAAAERKRQGSSVGGHGGKDKADAEAKVMPNPAGPSAGSIIDSLLVAHGVERGAVRDQAAKIAGIGSTSVDIYRRIKTAAEDASDPELAAHASGLLKTLNTPGASLKLDGARQSLVMAVKRLKSERLRKARRAHLDRLFGKGGTSEAEPGSSDEPDGKPPSEGSDEADDGADRGRTQAPEAAPEAAPETAPGTAEQQEIDELEESGYPLNGLPSRVPRNLEYWHPESPVWSCGEFQNYVEDLPWEPQGEVGLLLTDPPYGTKYGRSFEDSPEKADKLLIDMFELFEYYLAPNAHVVFFCGERQEMRMRAIMEKHAKYLNEERRLGWVQSKPGDPAEAQGMITGSPYSFAPALEIAIHATRGSPQHITPRTTPNGYVAPRIPTETRGHETEKPRGMLRRIIEATTVGGDIVADPFGGVASTLEAAVRAGRRGWSCEENNLHHLSGTKRINAVIEELRAARQDDKPTEGFYELRLERAVTGIPTEEEEAIRPREPMALPADPLGGQSAVLWGFGDPPREVLAASRSADRR